MSPRGWILFASMSVIWGVPYLFIKIAVDELSAGFVAWSRVAMAAAILLPIAWRTGALRGLSVRWLVAFAFVEITIPFPLIAFGEENLSSSLTAILIAAVPLMVAFLALRFDQSERPSRTRLVGMLVGLTGRDRPRGRRRGRQHRGAGRGGSDPRGDDGLRRRADDREEPLRHR